MNKKIYCILDDDKTQYLKRYGAKIGIDYVVPPIKKTLFPLFLIYSIILFKKPDAVIVRYLNDKPMFIYSLYLFISNMLTFFIAKLFKVKLIWFCHNVDKETIEFYPKLIKIQRQVLEKFSERILVMDKLLLNPAKKQFPDSIDKIDYISFGAREGSYRKVVNLKDDIIIDIANNIKSEHDNALIAFCPTNCGDKY